MTDNTRTSYNGDANIGHFFDLLVKKISVSMVENNKPQIKRLKSVIYTNIINNPILREELNLYTEVSSNRFSDRFVAKAFLEEILKIAKKSPFAKIQEELSKLKSSYEILNEGISETINESEFQNAKIYHLTNEVFAHVRKKSPTIVESRNYYKAFEAILDYLTTNQIQEAEKQQEIPYASKVLEQAVKRFNDKYSQLSETKKEIIQDFLNYRSLDRFKTSLLGRLRKVSTKLEEIEKTTDLQQISPLLKKLNEYYDEVSSSKSTDNINDIMLTVCDFVEVVEELQNYNSK